jgi:hypothetical protein
MIDNLQPNGFEVGRRGFHTEAESVGARLCWCERDDCEPHGCVLLHGTRRAIFPNSGSALVVNMEDDGVCLVLGCSHVPVRGLHREISDMRVAIERVLWAALITPRVKAKKKKMSESSPQHQSSIKK